MPFETDFGSVPLATLIDSYNKVKAANKRHVQKRNEFNQTEEGKVRNRERSKAYYERHKDMVREKARARYTIKRFPLENPESV